MAEANSQLNYHALQVGRRECFRLWGSVHDLPIIASAYQRYQVLYAELGGPVLDVGAGVDKPLQRTLNLEASAYYSLDDDPAGDFTYARIDAIPADQLFRLVVANQFFEHLTIDQGYAVMLELAAHLAPGGRLVVTVPNTSHPTRFWAVTHVTPWDYMSLYALLGLSGLRGTEIARYSKTPGPQTAEEQHLVATLARLYRIDWCDSLLIAGEKP